MIKVQTSLKKTAGRDLSTFLASNFEQEQVTTLLQSLFNNNGRDVKYIDPSEYGDLKAMLNKASEPDEDKEEVEPQNPVDLLREAGYTLSESVEFSDFDQYKKYFRHGEALCKFDDPNRTKHYRVFWIVKDNAERIKPNKNPEKGDEYSTSVCSIQVSKDGRNVTQITSRYNHTVPGCDNTVNSHLDNIVEGLTAAFNHYYGFSIQKNASQFEFQNFTFFDGKYVWYSREVNGVKFGDNTKVGTKLTNYNPDHYYIWDYFVINLKTKQIEWDDEEMSYHDGFVDVFNESVKRIEFVKDIHAVDDGDDDSVCYIQK